MNFTSSAKRFRGSAAIAGHVSPVTAALQPASTFLWPAVWLLAGMLFAAAWLLGGVEAATIVLAALIGGLALSRPRTALWASTAFLVYASVFYIKWSPVASLLQMGYLGTGIGLAMITLGLGFAWLGDNRRCLAIARNATVRRFDRVMYAMLVALLIAAAYGMAHGNGGFAVGRQLFGCLLLPGYYLFARTFFRTAEDVRHWLKWVSVAVTAGAAWYTLKLIFLSLSEGGYAREQSPLSGFAGAIGAVLFVELLWERERRKRILIGLSLLFCVLAILLTGARFVAGSLAATAIILLILRRRKRRLLVGLATLALVALAASLALAHLSNLIEQGGLIGGIAGRFSPLNLGEDLSYIGRMGQMHSVLGIVRDHPVLGGGMGAEYSFFAPGFPDVYGTTVYVDNGWGFILLKMGLVGLLIFVVMLWRFLKFAAGDAPSDTSARVERVRSALLAFLLSGLLNFIGGPTFFQFASSGLMGTTLGALAALAASRSRRRWHGSFPILREWSSPAGQNYVGGG